MPSQMKKEEKKDWGKQGGHSLPELIVTDCDGLLRFWWVADSDVIVELALLFKANTGQKTMMSFFVFLYFKHASYALWNW